jgi:hypothetical protein
MIVKGIHAGWGLVTGTVSLTFSPNFWSPRAGGQRQQSPRLFARRSYSIPARDQHES